jgi:adenylate cyclase
MGIAECERAVALGPNLASVQAYMGIVLRYTGRPEEAISAYKQAIRLDPFPSHAFYYGLGMSYCLAGEYEEAVSACRKAIQVEPKSFIARVFLAVVYNVAGREDEARTEASEVLRMNPNFLVESWAKTLPYKNQKDAKLIIDALQKAGLN